MFIQNSSTYACSIGKHNCHHDHIPNDLNQSHSFHHEFQLNLKTKGEKKLRLWQVMPLTSLVMKASKSINILFLAHSKGNDNYCQSYQNHIRFVTSSSYIHFIYAKCKVNSADPNSAQKKSMKKDRETNNRKLCPFEFHSSQVRGSMHAMLKSNSDYNPSL